MDSSPIRFQSILCFFAVFLGIFIFFLPEKAVGNEKLMAGLTRYRENYVKKLNALADEAERTVLTRRLKLRETGVNRRKKRMRFALVLFPRSSGKEKKILSRMVKNHPSRKNHPERRRHQDRKRKVPAVNLPVWERRAI